MHLTVQQSDEAITHACTAWPGTSHSGIYVQLALFTVVAPGNAELGALGCLVLLLAYGYAPACTT